MTKQKISPLFDNVLIKPLDGVDQLPSGIVLPDSAKEKPQMGEVMYKKWGGQEVKVEGKEWMLVEQKDILAIVE